LLKILHSFYATKQKHKRKSDLIKLLDIPLGREYVTKAQSTSNFKIASDCFFSFCPEKEREKKKKAEHCFPQL